MITITEFSQNIVNLIKPLISTDWKIAADLGDLENNKDLLAYFAVSNQNSIISNNATMQLDCEVVATVLFEQRSKEEITELMSNLYNGVVDAIDGIKKYEELDCGAVFLAVNYQIPQTETDELYYSFRLPLTIYAQF